MTVIVTGVQLCNGFRLHPDSERDAPIIEAAMSAFEGGFIHPRMCAVLRGAVVHVYEIDRRLHSAVRLA